MDQDSSNGGERVSPVPRWVGRLTLVLWVIGMGRLVWFVGKYAADFPAYDEWSLTGFFFNHATGQMTLSDWVLPHQGHLLIFPKAFFLGLYTLFGWSPRMECFLNLILLGAAAAVLIQINRATINGVGPCFPSCMLWPSLVIFLGLNPTENLIWGFQLAWSLVLLATLLTLFFLMRATESDDRKKSHRSFVAACLTGVLAQGSGGMGVLVWPAFFPILWLMTPGARRTLYLRIWSGLAVLAGLVVLLGRDGVSRGEPPGVLGYLIFFLKLVGAHFVLEAPGSEQAELGFAAQLTGTLLVALFLAVAGFGWVHRKDPKVGGMLPWICLGILSLGFSAMVTLSRAPVSPHQWLYTRYATFTQLLWIAVLMGMAHMPALLKGGGLLEKIRRPGVPAVLAAFLAVVFWGGMSRPAEYATVWEQYAHVNRGIFHCLPLIPEATPIDTLIGLSNTNTQAARECREKIRAAALFPVPERVVFLQGPALADSRVQVDVLSAGRGDPTLRLWGVVPALGPGGKGPILFVSPAHTPQLILCTLAMEMDRGRTDAGPMAPMFAWEVWISPVEKAKYFQEGIDVWAYDPERGELKPVTRGLRLP